MASRNAILECRLGFRLIGKALLFAMGVMHLSILCPTTPLPGNVGGMEGYLTSFDIKSSPIHGEFDSYHYACTEVCYK